MIERVWVSDCFMDSSNISKFNLNPDDQGKDYWQDTEYREELDRLDKLMRKHEDGETLTEDERPKRAYPRYKDRRIGKLSDFFRVNAFIVVSSDFAEVLGRFDLGKGGLSNIELYQGNRVELVPGAWYFLNLGCQKQTFRSGRSTGGFVQPDLWPKGKLMVSLPKDNQIAVGAAALEGCDLWTDPSLAGALFLSGRLEAALKAAKLTRNVRRARCMIVNED
ncbi:MULTISPECIES: hypothetical protein [unclassified Bradyrhizobium]|uniref:hypothetical protein n=1 Tax=unclassified Bradyrhizobium TaxID=2631580 RepID=UPI0028EA7816|nr:MULTISPECIES: hypothetical protein [unclassified Bradyrhizobium]